LQVKFYLIYTGHRFRVDSDKSLSSLSSEEPVSPGVQSIIDSDSEADSEHENHRNNLDITLSNSSENGDELDEVSAQQPAEEESHEIVKNRLVPGFSNLAGTIPTQKGSTKKVHNGYYYLLNQRTVTGTIYWRCDRHNVDSCPGRLIEEPDGTLRAGKAPHNHESNFGKEEAVLWTHSAKQQVLQKVWFHFFFFFLYYSNVKQT
jgi:hypothetical protein